MGPNTQKLMCTKTFTAVLQERGKVTREEIYVVENLEGLLPDSQQNHTQLDPKWPDFDNLRANEASAS